MKGLVLSFLFFLPLSVYWVISLQLRWIWVKFFFSFVAVYIWIHLLAGQFLYVLNKNIWPYITNCPLKCLLNISSLKPLGEANMLIICRSCLPSQFSMLACQQWVFVQVLDKPIRCTDDGARWKVKIKLILRGKWVSEPKFHRTLDTVDLTFQPDGGI